MLDEFVPAEAVERVWFVVHGIGDAGIGKVAQRGVFPPQREMPGAGVVKNSAFNRRIAE